MRKTNKSPLIGFNYCFYIYNPQLQIWVKISFLSSIITSERCFFIWGDGRERRRGRCKAAPGVQPLLAPSDFTCPRREGSYIWWEPFLLLGWQSGHSPNLPRTVPRYTCCAIISNNALFIFRRVLFCFHGQWLSDRLSGFSKWAKDQCRFRALAFLFSLVSFPSSNILYFKVEKKRKVVDS